MPYTDQAHRQKQFIALEFQLESLNESCYSKSLIRYRVT